MYILEMSKLEEGDIFLTSQRSIVSKGVRFFTNSDYSHAIFYTGQSRCIHSELKGVHSENVQRLLFDDPSRVKVLRLRDPALKSAVSDAVAHVRVDVGMQYSISEAIKAKANPRATPRENRQFCSRLIAQGYDRAGIRLVAAPSFCSPEDLGNSPMLQAVVGCIRQASPEEEAFANSESPLKKQARITNSILRKARRLSGSDIQNFDQLKELLIENPSLDGRISTFVRASGYLGLWLEDFLRNPWRYDHRAFLALPISTSEKGYYATLELKNALEKLDETSRMREAYLRLWSQHQLGYFALLTQLYSNLNMSNQQRKDTAEAVLEKLSN